MGYRRIDGGGVQMIEVGTLVRFNAPEVFSASRRRYPKFGVVVGSGDGTGGVQPSWKVQWINGKTTNEHECYLKEVSHDNL